MNNFIVTKALEKLLHDQPGIVQRKDSLTLFLVSVVWLSSMLVTYGASLPVWVGATAGGVVSIGGILLVALTKGAITPSMVTRAEKAAEEIAKNEPERPSDAPTAPVQVQAPVESYEGLHRLSEPSGGIAGHYLKD